MAQRAGSRGARAHPASGRTGRWRSVIVAAAACVLAIPALSVPSSAQSAAASPPITEVKGTLTIPGSRGGKATTTVDIRRMGRSVPAKYRGVITFADPRAEVSGRLTVDAASVRRAGANGATGVARGVVVRQGRSAATVVRFTFDDRSSVGGGADRATLATVGGGYGLDGRRIRGDVSVRPIAVTPPKGSVVVAGGAAFTAKAAVLLTLAATDDVRVTQMRVANGSNPASAPWRPYAKSLRWTLPAGDGTKTVSAQFRDAAGNRSPVSTDTITLDTSAPTITNPTGDVDAAPGDVEVQGTVADPNGLSAVDVLVRRTPSSQFVAVPATATGNTYRATLTALTAAAD
jgi:hypothetical protein